MEKNRQTQQNQGPLYNQCGTNNPNSKKIRYTASKVLILSVILLTGITNTALGQSIITPVTLEVLPGSEMIMIAPDNFNFDPTFIPEDSQTSIYRTLNPAIENDTLIVGDLDDSRKFDVTLTLSDLTTGDLESRIHYTDLAFNTLSSSLSDDIDTATWNNPTGSPNIINPFYCNWKPNQGMSIVETCDTQLHYFTAPTTNSSTLIFPIHPGFSIIQVADSSLFINPSIILTISEAYVTINDDLISYTGISGNSLTGISNIDTSHMANDVVTQYPDTSTQVTLLSDTDPVDIGLFSQGFIFKMDVDTHFKPQNYNGTLTFTLITF